MMNYKIVDISEIHIQKLIDFYVKNGEAPYEWYAAKFQYNYDNKMLLGSVCVNSENDEIIGSYLGLRQQLLSNKNLTAAQSIDTLIAQQARGSGLLKKLAFHYYETLKSKGFHCVFGLPNKNIEQLRYRLLGWNKSRDVYLFVSYFPAPFLRFFSVLLDLIHYKNVKLDSTAQQAIEVFQKIKTPYKILYSSAGSITSATYDSSFCTKVGFIRYQKKMSLLKRFEVFCSVARRGRGFFLTTYATLDSETAGYFRFFSFKKVSSPFCGLNLNADPPYSFGEQSLEFIEFDTFGFI